MSTLLAVATCAVVLLCLARALGLSAAVHHRDVDWWHVVMGTVMASMLVAPLPRPVAVLTVGLAAVGVVWSVVRLVCRAGPGPYLRLALGWVAMAVMVLPVAPASAATGSGGTAGMSGMSATSGMAAMRGMTGTTSHGGHSSALAATGSTTPSALVAVALVALVVVGLLRAAAALRPSTTAGCRWDAGCDVVMAAAMGSMLMAMV